MRFAQAVERQVVEAGGRRVEELVVAGRHYAGGEESAEREVRLAALPNRAAAIRTAGSERARLREGGALAGALVWSWEPLHGTVEGWTERIASGLWLVRVEVANRMEWDPTAPARNRMRTLRSIEVDLHSRDGALVPLAAATA